MKYDSQRKRQMDLGQRLLENRRVTEEGCWEWTASVTQFGYGRMSWKGRIYRVHRLSAHYWLGLELGGKVVVRHKCDNPPCFNPSHLGLGTQSDNVNDMMERGRWAGGGKRLLTCPKGHPLSGANEKKTRTGRRCRECSRVSNRAYYLRRKAREGAFWQPSVKSTIQALEGDPS